MPWQLPAAADGVDGELSVIDGLDRPSVAIYRSSIYNEEVAEIREPTFLVLVALAEGRRHGYGIIQDVERLSNGKTTLRPGTLYATLDRLVSDGVIEGAGEEIVEGRLRRYYCLTQGGSAVLESESQQRFAVSKEALRRLRAPTRRPRLAGGFT